MRLTFSPWPPISFSAWERHPASVTPSGRRRGGNASAQPEEWLCAEMHGHGPGRVGRRGVMGKISRSDLAGLGMSQSGARSGLTKEWKLSRGPQAIMNCSLCLNSRPPNRAAVNIVKLPQSKWGLEAHNFQGYLLRSPVWASWKNYRFRWQMTFLN